MNKTSELIEELIKINNDLMNENEELKKSLEENTIIESKEDIKEEKKPEIKENDKIRYGRLVKFFRGDRVCYVRELFINDKKINVPLY